MAAAHAPTAAGVAAADAVDPPLFSFGLLADAQYADLPDGDTEGRRQAYREVPHKLRAALADLCGHGCASPAAAGGGETSGRGGSGSGQQRLQFVMHLGDIVNGNPGGQALSDAEFEVVASFFEEELMSELPAVHVIGNHCLSVPRSVLLQRLGIPPTCYYSRSLGSGWRLVVLDTTEMSGHSDYPPGSEQYQEAQDFMAAHPLREAEPHMSSWNGGVTQRQLSWLRAELAAAEAARERVLVASHHPIGRGSARPTHMAWNCREVQEALLASPAFRVAFAGHDHMGGYACVEGQHFVTIEGLLEAPTGSNAYAVVHVFPDRLCIHGGGSVSSRELAV